MAGLNDLTHLFQPKELYDSTILILSLSAKAFSIAAFSQDLWASKILVDV